MASRVEAEVCPDCGTALERGAMVLMTESPFGRRCCRAEYECPKCGGDFWAWAVEGQPIERMPEERVDRRFKRYPRR